MIKHSAKIKKWKADHLKFEDGKPEAKKRLKRTQKLAQKVSQAINVKRHVPIVVNGIRLQTKSVGVLRRIKKRGQKSGPRLAPKRRLKKPSHPSKWSKLLKS